ncbi:MAG TPA: hypothetical protein PKK43_05845 [Spirochaetota bacterium]|nr:hypothetical protein [Spirochaetota bacterium]
MEKLNQFLFFKPYLHKISEANFFRAVFVWFLRIVAFVQVLFLLFSSFQMWRFLSNGFQASYFFFFLITQILLIILTYFVITILFSRADDIEKLPLKNDYIVIPIFVVVTKMSGEILAVFYAISGVIVACAIWIVGQMTLPIPGIWLLQGSTGFFGGLFSLIMGPVVGFIVLSIAYFAAEQIGVLVDIARNTKK